MPDSPPSYHESGNVSPEVSRQQPQNLSQKQKTSPSNDIPPPYDILSVHQPEALPQTRTQTEEERHTRAIQAYNLKREEEEKIKAEGEKETLGWTGMFFVALLGLSG